MNEMVLRGLNDGEAVLVLRLKNGPKFHDEAGFIGQQIIDLFGDRVGVSKMVQESEEKSS